MARGRGPGKGAGKGPGKKDLALHAFEEGVALVRAHGLFGPLLARCGVNREKKNYCPPNGWAVVVDSGEIHVHPTRRGTPAEWAHVLAHAVLHLALEHFRVRDRPVEWNAACCAAAARFLAGMKFGRVPEELLHSGDLPARAEDALYEEWRGRGVPDGLRELSLAGPGVPDLWWLQGAAAHLHHDRSHRFGHITWAQAFSDALQTAVARAIDRAAGAAEQQRGDTPGTRARTWFLNHFPLLGSLAMTFDIIEDPALLARMDIAIGAVDAEVREIFLHSAKLNDEECRFVIAHELLHVGLRHETRRMGRDPFLWNVACDYVINGWLLEMNVGQMPRFGGLHDPAVKGLSAEAIYDQMVGDLRKLRKLATLRGAGLGDMIDRTRPGWWNTVEGMRLDEFYRSCLGQGLVYHEEQGRGLLPGGLVEEIRALAHPPIPWDVELAQWFDGFFSPIEMRRTYARASRRQSSTPDIPRPRTTPTRDAMDGRTFGVVLDTSISMDTALLARGLGAIASYAMSRDVPFVRVIFCDAAPHDAGFMAPEDIGTRRVKVRGRGGTLLQPGIDLLEKAEDFPDDGPILVITDTRFDERLRVKRPHAYLIPEGFALPFPPRGKVFRMK